MVLDLEIEAPGQVPRDAPPIGAAGLNLGLVPVDRLARLPRLSDGVTLRILEVVRECEGNGLGWLALVPEESTGLVTQDVRDWKNRGP